MSKVFDLDAFIAEANGEPFEFQFGGETYRMPPHVDIRAIPLMAAGRFDVALRIMLGEEQWERMLAASAVFDEAALVALMEEYAKHSGMTVGESLASTASSRSTAKRSRPTSNGRTTPRSRG